MFCLKENKIMIKIHIMPLVYLVSIDKSTSTLNVGSSAMEHFSNTYKKGEIMLDQKVLILIDRT